MGLGEALLDNVGWPQNSCVDVLCGLAWGGRGLGLRTLWPGSSGLVVRG